MGALTKFLMDQGVEKAASEVLGAQLTGWETFLNSTNAGGYMDPDFIQGYRFNPADKRWYSTPPSPAYGNYSWANPASSSMQAMLNQTQYWRNFNNENEGVTPINGAAGAVTADPVNISV